MADAPLPAEPSAVEPVEPEDDDLSSKTAEPDPDWAPTEDPSATVVPGEMRSDREGIPAPFTKEDADKAETMEARQRMSRAAAGCQTYWPSPYEVCGVIRDKYNSLGGPASFLSFPNSPEYTNPDGYGKRTQFLNGPIYWSAATGAHPVVNSFLNRWQLNGYEAGRLKYPTTDEIVLPDGGRRQEFQQGVIYVAFQNAVGSALINGPLRDKYNSVGGLTPGTSFLGYLIQDQIAPLPDGQGQMARFQNGVIYYHPTYGAHPVSGTILNSWALGGYESGTWGYPGSDEYNENGEPAQVFQNHVVNVETQYASDPADPNGQPLARQSDGRATVTSDGQVQFYAGDSYSHSLTRGVFNARRGVEDSRLLTASWNLTQTYILSKAAYGFNTMMDCSGYMYNAETGRFLIQDNSDKHKNVPIDYRYHISQSRHDDNTDYQMVLGCTFENKTRQQAGSGNIGYGITIARYVMGYEFLI
ncbi:hypothetical protein [Rhodococcus sp. 1168]|uniref:LGFP repeat-containing protein n=1 Tax=Rhodococcus sp. 1168 TaxID=2018041 RepID=UPI0020CB47ED|nr:hypothetical protein [Rhodococcus sp. 1168]